MSDISILNKNIFFLQVVDRKDGLVLFVVYMCFADESRFYILNLTNKGTLIRWATIYAPKGQDLVEFAASNSTLWAVWGSPDGEPCVSYTSFAPENVSTIPTTIILLLIIIHIFNFEKFSMLK